MSMTSSIERLINRVPTFNPVLDDGKRYQLPIIDHQPIMMDTAVGPIVSLNCCSRQRYRPELTPEGITAYRGVKLSDPDDISKRYILLTNYICRLAAAGVVAFILQEVPNQYEYLYHFASLIYVKGLSHNHELDTTDFFHSLKIVRYTKYSFGFLINKNYLEQYDPKQSETLNAQVQAHYNPPCYDYLSAYHCCLLENKTNHKKIRIMNLLGDYNRPLETAKFISQAYAMGFVVAGNFNIRKDNPDAIKHLPSNPIATYDNSQLDTIDAILDGDTAKSNQHSASQAKTNTPAAPTTTQSDDNLINTKLLSLLTIGLCLGLAAYCQSLLLLAIGVGGIFIMIDTYCEEITVNTPGLRI